MTGRRRQILVMVLLAFGLVGCVRGCRSSRPPIHINPDMDQQPKVRAQAESDFFYDGATMRLPIPGTVARGQLVVDPRFHTGREIDGAFVARSPQPASADVMVRGARQYGIYCRPCHDKKGNGQGILFERGSVPTTSFHDERLLAVPDGEIFDVITNGKGLMPAYGYPISPADRWAIIANVRRIQQERQSDIASTGTGGNAVSLRVKIVLGLVAVALALVTVRQITYRLLDSEYRQPARVEQVDATPRMQGLEDQRVAAEEEAQARPYEEEEYRAFPRVGSRVAVWVLAQLHLYFAAFVLAVPIFALIIEFIGYRTGDKRYDKLAYEFTKLLSVSFSFTATLGAFLLFMLLMLYPKFMGYLGHVFSPTFAPYVALFFFEALFLYSYYYGWGKFHPRVHLLLGVMLNLVGTGIMFIANAWLTFMTSPAGVSESGARISTWEAVSNYTWMPINIHRIIANVAFGGAVAAAYAAFKYLHAKTDEERAHYDWMGYIGNFVAICAFLPLPFAGYWLASEIYAFSQTLGLTMMGGAFSWLFIIQAALIGNLFLAANYYLWLGMGRIEGAGHYQKFIKWLLIAIALCFAVWATPRSIISTVSEVRAMGGSSHPQLGFLGVMSAKNTAVNILILSTYMSFLLYRRTGKRAVHRLKGILGTAQFGIFAAAASIVIFYGIYGYFVDAKTRISFSVPQVGSVLLAMILITVIDVVLFRGAEKTGETHWGRMPAISQYVLIFIAISFTWLMGLMGYVRSGLRQHWHVYGVVRDTSPDAFTPTLGFATQVVSVTVLIFFSLIGVVFWLSSLSGMKDWEPRSGDAV